MSDGRDSAVTRTWTNVSQYLRVGIAVRAITPTVVTRASVSSSGRAAIAPMTWTSANRDGSRVHTTESATTSEAGTHVPVILSGRGAPATRTLTSAVRATRWCAVVMVSASTSSAVTSVCAIMGTLVANVQTT